MSMDEDEEEAAEHPHPQGIKQRMGSGMFSPDVDASATLIHRDELDDQERLDLEEEAREREISGQGFSGAQTSGATAAVQAGA
jgi:hypothetical protein